MPSAMMMVSQECSVDDDGAIVRCPLPSKNINIVEFP